MDYDSQPFGIKVKKVLRYRSLYGWRQTWAKIQGHRHMKRGFSPSIRSNGGLGADQTVGLVGCGNYAFTTIAHFLTRARGQVIGACMDTDPRRAASLGAYYGVPLYTSDARELIEHPHIRLVYIASNHASHAEYAIACLRSGKDVFIEKPHVVNEDQLRHLTGAMLETDGRVYLGFNRTQSDLGRILKRALDRQTGTGIFNWFVVGHRLAADHWYLHPGEGSRVLGNLCHWTDFLFALAGPDCFPIRIIPVRDRAYDVNVVVNFVFGNGAIGTISFTEGDNLEGIREKFCGRRGDCMITLDDFRKLTVETSFDRKLHRSFHRDHGHRNNILAAYDSSLRGMRYDRHSHLFHISNTAHIFLNTKRALESNENVVVNEYLQAMKRHCAA